MRGRRQSAADRDRSRGGASRRRSDGSGGEGRPSNGRLVGSDRIVPCGGIDYVLPKHYMELKAIGKGSYGVVASALNAKEGRRVAIKRISPISQNASDAKHVLRELRLVRHLGQHPNVITLLDCFVREERDELYLVMELMDSDLHRIIQSSQPLTEAHSRYFMLQLVRGVAYLHENRIIHRDLKPGNLLVSRNCDLRITDFGLARERPKGVDDAAPDEGVVDPMTEHVVTRWYRPPELMLCPDGLYSYGVDMWSVGCILAELLGRRPLFPGKNFVHQLQLIFDAIGAPLACDIAHIRGSQARRFLTGVASKRAVPFAVLFPSATQSATQLLSGLLRFPPAQRESARACLRHAFFHPLTLGREDGGRMADMALPDGASEHLDFAFESERTTKRALRRMLQEETHTFRRDERRRAKHAAREEASGAQRRPSSGGSASTASSSRSSERLHAARERAKLLQPQLNGARRRSEGGAPAAGEAPAAKAEARRKSAAAAEEDAKALEAGTTAAGSAARRGPFPAAEAEAEAEMEADPEAKVVAEAEAKAPECASPPAPWRERLAAPRQQRAREEPEHLGGAKGAANSEIASEEAARGDGAGAPARDVGGAAAAVASPPAAAPPLPPRLVDARSSAPAPGPAAEDIENAAPSDENRSGDGAKERAPRRPEAQRPAAHEGAAAGEGAAGGGAAPGKAEGAGRGRGRRLTVPKSPKFATMSWQKKPAARPAALERPRRRSGTAARRGSAERKGRGAAGDKGRRVAAQRAESPTRVQSRRRSLPG